MAPNWWKHWSTKSRTWLSNFYVIYTDFLLCCHIFSRPSYCWLCAGYCIWRLISKNNMMTIIHAFSVAQLSPTLCSPMDYSLPDSSVHGIFQAEVLELVVISSSRGSSWSKDRTPISCVSCIGKWILYHCTIWEVQWLSYCYLYPERIHISFSQVSGTTSNIGLSESNFWACNFSGPHRWIKTIPCECDFIMVFWNLVLWGYNP